MRHLTKTFAIDELLQTLESAGVSCQRQGREIEADFDGAGHHSYKLNPGKGVYFSTSGKKGTIAALLRHLPVAAPRASEPVTVQGRSQDTCNIARRVRASGWTCTHDQDLPAGWDKGLSAGQKATRRGQIEEERDAVIAYLIARLGPAHLTHWLRQVRIARDRNGRIMMLTPMYKDGVIVGVQRSYLTAGGQKIERKMLGQKGVLALPPAAGVLPAQITEARAVLVGEGFETVAAAVQAAGQGGIVCFDAAGLVTWAEDQAKAAQGKTKEQLEKAPAAIFLVDNDKNQTGQKSAAKAVRLLRKAGLKAHFALPRSPEDGGPNVGKKGSDWADYPAETLNHALVAHLQMAVSHGDDEMPEPEDGDEKPAIALDFKGWQANARPSVQMGWVMSKKNARMMLKRDLNRVIKTYLEWIKLPEDQRGPMPPALFQITTGVGKSHILKKLPLNPDIRMSGGRIVVSVQTHEQALEYEAAGYFHFWGRQDPIAKPELPDAHCLNFVSLKDAQEREHIAQAEVCSKCSHGLAWAIKNAQAELTRGAEGKRADVLENRISQHKAELTRRGLDIKNVEPCHWQDHLRDAMNAQFVVMVHQSYSHAVVGDALYFTDESFETGKTIRVTLQDVSQWAERNRKAITRLESLESLDKNQIKDLENHRQAAQFLEILAARMAYWAGQGKSGTIEIDADLVQAIQSLIDSVGGKVSLAAWEKLGFDLNCALDESPLRAAFALAESLSIGGSAFVQDGALVVAASLPIVERIRAGLPTVIMDATPPKAIRDIVLANEGQILRRIARQNLRIERYPQRFWGLSALKEKRVGKVRMDREVARYQTLLSLYSNTATIMHKQAFDLLPAADQQNPLLDYWGRGHRAQNRMDGSDLNIVGSFFPPESVWQSLYTADRLAALAGGADPAQWPIYPNEMQTTNSAWINEGSGKAQSRLPLPADEQIKTWLLDKVTNETVQAVGRARGVNADQTLTVRIFGGVPLAGLGQHGLVVTEYLADSAELGQTRDQVNAQRHESAMIQMDQAAGRIVAKGQIITRESMAAEYQATGTDGPLYGHGNSPHTKPVQTHSTPFSAETYRKWLERIQTVAPALFSHMSETGRGAAVVKAMIEAQRQWGEEALKYAVEMTENLVKQGDGVLWNVLDNLDGQILEADCLPGTSALQAVVSALLGCEPPG